MMNSLRDNCSARIGQYPPFPNLGRRRAFLKGLGDPLEAIGEPRRQARPAARRRVAQRLVEIVGKHQRDEQHRALAAHPAGGALGLGPALADDAAEPLDLRLLAVAAGDGVTAAADRHHHLGHHWPPSRAITSSSAVSASAMRDLSAAWRRASALFASLFCCTARSMRLSAHSIRSSSLWSPSAMKAG